MIKGRKHPLSLFSFLTLCLLILCLPPFPFPFNLCHASPPPRTLAVSWLLVSMSLFLALVARLLYIAGHSHTWPISAVRVEVTRSSRMLYLYSGLHSCALSHPRSLYSLSSVLCCASSCTVLLKLC